MGSANQVASRDKAKEYRFKPYSLRLYVPNNNTEDIPIPRSGHRIASDNANCYSFGGFNPDADGDEDSNDEEELDGEVIIMGTTKLFKEIWRFNVATSRWQNLKYYIPSLPKELASNAVVMKGSTMIVHGGTGVPFGHARSNKTYFTNLRTDRKLKRMVTEGSPPPPLYGQAMAASDSHLYVVGGTSGYAFSCDVHELNLRTKQWKVLYNANNKGLRDKPEGRYRHEVALYDDKLYVFGGGTVNIAFGFEKLHVFDLATREWALVSTQSDLAMTAMGDTGYPAPRRCHGSVQVPEDKMQAPEFVICGGYDGEFIFADIWKINLSTLQWTNCRTTLPQTLYFHSTSLAPNGQMFIFGGIHDITEDDHEVRHKRNNDFSAMWVIIPKLSEMCWDALLHYNPNLPLLSNLELVCLGIPSQFVDRVERPGIRL